MDKFSKMIIELPDGTQYETVDLMNPIESYFEFKLHGQDKNGQPFDIENPYEVFNKMVKNDSPNYFYSNIGKSLIDDHERRIKNESLKKREENKEKLKKALFNKKFNQMKNKRV